MPPAFSGLPVTQAEALMSVVFIRRYWSTIQAISRSPVPMSGAGTFWLGLIRSRLAELVGEAAGDQLHLVLVPLARVDAEPALGAAERHLDEAALVGHQRRQRLDLVLVHAHREADAALDRLHMLGMHAAVAGEGVDRAAQPDPEAHGVGRVADADLLLEARGEVHQPDRPVEHQVDGFAKARLAKRRVHGFLLPVRSVRSAFQVDHRPLPATSRLHNS